MNNEEYSIDSLAMILLCSNLAINYKVDKLKPFTTVEWSKFAKIILNSSIKRPGNLFNLTEEEIKKELFICEQDAEKIVALLSKAGQLSFELNDLKNIGIKVLTRADKLYPAALKEKLKDKCPPVIFYSGDIDIINNKLVGVVGSRNIDSDGLIFTKKIGEKIVNENYSLVSGGAKGVDSVAQEEVLRKNGKVIAFIADSMVNNIKKKEIREAITKGNLLLMSSTNPKSGFTVYSAMDRNKYIYLLSKLTIVVSSDYNKGGTWAGAIENLKNSWVPLLVRNESNVPRGNQELIKLGGRPLCNITEALFDDYIKGTNNKSDKYYEADLFSLIKNIANVQDDKPSCNIDLPNNLAENNLCKKNEVIESYDVYPLIVGNIKEILNNSLSLEEFSDMLNVNKKQANDWLSRAINDGIVVKLNKPVRYKSV